MTESNVAASGCAMASALVVGVGAQSSFGWRIGMAPPVVSVALLFALLRSHPLGDARVRGAGPRGPIRLTSSFWMLCAVVFLGVAAEWCVGYWGAEFLTASLALSPEPAASALGLFFVAMLTGRLAASRLARRCDDRTLLIGALSVATSGFVLTWTSRAPVPALAGLALTGLGLAGVYPIGLSAAVGAVPAASDTAAARVGIAGGAAILVLPLVVGRLADAVGILRSFGLVIPLLAAAAVIAVLVRPGDKSWSLEDDAAADQLHSGS